LRRRRDAGLSEPIYTLGLFCQGEYSPNFDQKLKLFKDARPLGSDWHSMNEIHNHRSVVNDVNIHVAGDSPVERAARPLGRPRNADLIRNTASYAA
jgi:hypothetical protein